MTSSDLSPSRQRLSTATGSVYDLLISDGGSALTRHPGQLPVHPSMDGAELTPMRRDADAIKVLKVLHLAIDEQAIFVLDVRRDGIPTIRKTSPVISIEQVPTD